MTIVDPLFRRSGNDYNCFRTITSVNQLSLYGAVAEMCEEYEPNHDRMVRPVVGGQSSSSSMLSVIKTEVPLHSGGPARKEFLLQRYGETN